MKKTDPALLHDAVENYYIHRPDTLMPLLMLAAAVNGKLTIVESESFPAASLCHFEPAKIASYNWVEYDDRLKERVALWIKKGVRYVSIVADLNDELKSIYEIFQKNDTVDVVREHHHRMGRLVKHSSNALSEAMHREYAAFQLAEVLLTSEPSFLRNRFLFIFNHILVKSGLQPERERLMVGRALTLLLEYDGEGLLYYPYAGASIAGAMIQPSQYHGDADPNPKLYAAGQLLNYGMGLSNEHYVQRDSNEWLPDQKIDYVISTYLGSPKDQTTFDFCLGKLLADKSFTGRYVGMAMPKSIFEQMTVNFHKALCKDWIESIVLLNTGEVAISIDANKQSERKGIIRIVDGTHPMAQNTGIDALITNEMYAQYITTEEALIDGHLKSTIVVPLGDRDGYEKVLLSEVIKPLEYRVFDLHQFAEEDCVMAYVNRKETYYGRGWDENIEKRIIHNLLSPAYFLKQDCLLLNTTGLPQPRLYNADNGCAFFEDGFAFEVNNGINPEWLANELLQPYIIWQLHPYGMNPMVPESLTVGDYLNLQLFIPARESKIDSTEDQNKNDALPAGFVLNDGICRYQILNYIACGSFGYTYRAVMNNLSNGEREIVAIKEFYPTGRMECWRSESNRVIVDPQQRGRFESDRELFCTEPQFINKLADASNNHVAEIKSLFDYEPTGTTYYVMKYYAGASVQDMIEGGKRPNNEELIIQKIVVPLCKAMEVMHSHHILHLDIKPDNIVLDENGEAVLIDFGVAHQYAENGTLISVRETHSTSCYSAPENSEGGMRHFEPRSDIYGVAGSLFSLMSNGLCPIAIHSPEEYCSVKDAMDCSEQMSIAIADGLWQYANDRPDNATAFLHKFPNCNNC